MNLEQDQNILSSKNFKSEKSRTKIKILKWGIGISILILLISSIVFIFYPSSSTRIIEIFTKRGETLKHELPDGSFVWLNENSRISFPEEFSSTGREMHLLGEAYFEVEHDLWRPFKVHTSNVVVELLEASFNLKTNLQKDTVELIVVDGKVSFYSQRNPTEEVIVEAGMAGFYYRATDAVFARLNTNDNYLAWQKDILVFNNTPVHEVVDILKRRYRTEITIASLDLINCTITNTFENATLKEILDYLAEAIQIEYSKEGEVYILTGSGCPA